ncbi:hypothetical protein [Candidatus Poriferisodalis sp.]|uniref:hypothetical protein n=1 Tax=Candidatus Poriferisodalis sp. TaxID=3101277 RepID=UPI003D13F60D
MSLGLGQVIAAAAATLIMALGIADVTRIGRQRFAAAKRRRTNWILLIVLFGPLAVLLYAAAVRPQVLHPERYVDDDDDDDVDDQTPARRRHPDGASLAGAQPEAVASGEQGG